MLSGGTWIGGCCGIHRDTDVTIDNMCNTSTGVVLYKKSNAAMPAVVVDGELCSPNLFIGNAIGDRLVSETSSALYNWVYTNTPCTLNTDKNANISTYDIRKICDSPIIKLSEALHAIKSNGKFPLRITSTIITNANSPLSINYTLIYSMLRAIGLTPKIHMLNNNSVNSVVYMSALLEEINVELLEAIVSYKHYPDHCLLNIKQHLGIPTIIPMIELTADYEITDGKYPEAGHITLPINSALLTANYYSTIVSDIKGAKKRVNTCDIGILNTAHKTSNYDTLASRLGIASSISTKTIKRWIDKRLKDVRGELEALSQDTSNVKVNPFIARNITEPKYPHDDKYTLYEAIPSKVINNAKALTIHYGIVDNSPPEFSFECIPYNIVALALELNIPSNKDLWHKLNKKYKCAPPVLDGVSRLKISNGRKTLYELTTNDGSKIVNSSTLKDMINNITYIIWDNCIHIKLKGEWYVTTHLATNVIIKLMPYQNMYNVLLNNINSNGVFLV